MPHLKRRLKTNMPTRIDIIHTPNESYASEIRGILCKETYSIPIEGRNPLMETDFNLLLQKITQSAFDAGMSFTKQHPDLNI